MAGAGCAAIIPPNAAHSVKALTDVRAIVVDYPRRNSIGGIALYSRMLECRHGDSSLRHLSLNSSRLPAG